MVKGTYADLQVQALYGEGILSQCHKADLSAWNRVQELRKIFESYPRVRQGQKETVTDTLRRLSKTLQIGVTDSEGRQIFLESLAFKKANLECKK